MPTRTAPASGLLDPQLTAWPSRGSGPPSSPGTTRSLWGQAGAVPVGRGTIRRMTNSHAGRGLDMLRTGDFPFYTLTFVRDLSPSELLVRMGADPAALALRDGTDLSDDFGDDLLDDEPVVTTGVDGAWTWAWEQGGVHGIEERILGAVSVGTEAVSLHYNEKPMYWFKYAVDGDAVVGFHTLQEIEPTGQDPARLDGHMRPLGLVPGRCAPLYRVLSLIEGAFGIRLTGAGKADVPRLSGRLRPLPE